MSPSDRFAGLRNRTGLSPVFLLFLAALIGLPISLVLTVQSQIKADSLESARAISVLMLEVRRYYNLNIVGRLQQGEHPVVVSENYKETKGAIPLPATMSIEVADLLTQKIPNSPFDFSFVSDYPFKGRNRPAIDDFQREALESFRAQPELEEYWREDRSRSGARSLRLAIPVRMQKVCIDCHNGHPDSTFRSWSVGDIRGVQDVTVRHSISEGRLNNFLFLGGYLVVFTALLFLALNEYRRSNFRLRSLNAEQSRNREELEQQREQLVSQMNDLVTKTTVLDKAPFGIVIADPHRIDLPIVYINEAFSRITGYTAQEVLGRNCRVLQGPETDSRAIDEIRASLRERQYLDLEIINYRRDGRPFHNRLQLFPCVNAAGELVSYVGCTADITDLKLAQAEREQLAAELQESLKLQSMGLAIAGIAHDLNTPIGVALTASTHLVKTVQRLTAAPSAGAASGPGAPSLANLEKTAELIVSNLQKAAELVRSFRRTTVDAGQVEWRRVGLKSFFDSLLMSISPIVKRAHCEVQLDCPAGAELHSEPGSLGQVITNLVVNATIHAFEGRDDRRITITVAPGDDQVEICIADNGNGMTQEALSKAFTPFFTTRRGAGGSGLGLFSSRRVVEEMLGGKISVSSQAGAGTRFTIVLPRQRAS